MISKTEFYEALIVLLIVLLINIWYSPLGFYFYIGWSIATFQIIIYRLKKLYDKYDKKK